MHLLISIFLAGATLSLVQALQNASTILPQCTQHCKLQAFNESSCTATNLTCACKDPKHAIVFGKCETKSCTAAGQNVTNAYASSPCAQIGGHGLINSTTFSTAASVSGTATPTGNGTMIYNSTTVYNGTFMGTPSPFSSGAAKGCGAVVLVGLLLGGMAIAL